MSFFLKNKQKCTHNYVARFWQTGTRKWWWYEIFMTLWCTIKKINKHMVHRHSFIIVLGHSETFTLYIFQPGHKQWTNGRKPQLFQSCHIFSSAVCSIYNYVVILSTRLKTVQLVVIWLLTSLNIISYMWGNRKYFIGKMWTEK